MKRTIGLIVNPLAGIGGKVGLKGSDGAETVLRAFELGAVPSAPNRTVEALTRISTLSKSVQLVTYPFDMGEFEARKAGFEPIVVGSIVEGRTTSADTKSAASHMLKIKVDLLLFSGGDGTARDILDVIGQSIPVIGIPAGVKIHSAVFCVNPRNSGDLAARFLQGETLEIREMEVMDVDEAEFREGRISARLYGYLKVPFERALVQGAKMLSSVDEQSAALEIAREIVESMETDCTYVVGPGTTTKAIMDFLGLKKTLLGVDLIRRRKLVAVDVSENQLQKIVTENKSKVIVTVIGGQGFIFGRGNQQISAQIIKRVGKENILVVATPGKLASLRGAPLLVDTGDAKLDKTLAGYVRVTTGYGKSVIYHVSNGAEPKLTRYG
jgi:predicted polyphosphate/ATP-dependent NAD kinase